jgi:hypothetical protein
MKIRFGRAIEMNEVTTTYKGFRISHSNIENDSHVFVVDVASDNAEQRKLIFVSTSNYDEAVGLAKCCVDAKVGDLPPIRKADSA